MRRNFEVIEASVLTPGALSYLSESFRMALGAARGDETAAKPSFHKEARKYFRRNPRVFGQMLSALRTPAIAAAVRARAAKPYLDHMDLLIKEVGAPETGWHQDRPYWGWDQPPSMFTIWIALGDMGPDDGCLRFAGTEVREVYPHRMLAYGPGAAFSALLIDPVAFDVSTLGVQPIPLRAGQAAIFDSFTVHGAFPNRSGRPRLSFKLVIGDRAQRSARGGTRILDLGSRAFELNRRLGFVPAFVGFHTRDAVASRSRRVLGKLRRTHGAR